MINIRAFVIAFSLIIFSVTLQAEIPSEKQIEEWQRLYPKLNFKMARMEELLNYIDRFLGDAEFKKPMLSKAVEFTYLAEASLLNIPKELPKEQIEPFKKALIKVSKLGRDLHLAIQEDRIKDVQQCFKKLDEIRRKSHSDWVF